MIIIFNYSEEKILRFIQRKPLTDNYMQLVNKCSHLSHRHKVQAVFSSLKNTDVSKTQPVCIQFS